jgi:CRP-like cAMP-binding protein
MAEEISPGALAIAGHFEQVAQLQHASNATRTRLAICSSFRSYEADAFILQQGQPVDVVQVILQGQVHVTLVNAAGETIWLYSAGPGILLDPIALLTPPVMPYSIRALSQVDLVEIPRDCMAEAIAAEPRVGFETMHVLAQRMYLVARLVDRKASTQPR